MEVWTGCQDAHCITLLEQCPHFRTSGPGYVQLSLELSNAGQVPQPHFIFKEEQLYGTHVVAVRVR